MARASRTTGVTRDTRAATVEAARQRGPSVCVQGGSVDDSPRMVAQRRRVDEAFGADARGPADVVVQRVRSVRTAVAAQAVLSAHRSGEWMVVQGLGEIGHPQWHLTIFPIGQATWTPPFQLPASGARGIADFMQYSEFHLTSPEGEHFFYTDDCVPLRGSARSAGASVPWAQAKRWSLANAICARWFSVDLSWLESYVADRPRAEAADMREEQAEQKHQERMWTMFKKSMRDKPEWHAETKMSFDDWVQMLERGFQGSHQQFRELVKRESEEDLPPVPHGPWRKDEGGYGYEEPPQ